MSYRIGCDVGGTFTDICIVEPNSGTASVAKVPTTAGRQAKGVLDGTTQALLFAGLVPNAVAGFSHGTTVAVNAVLERSGAAAALIVTRGFRDLLSIGRQTRPHLYDATIRRPPPLVPPALTFEVTERIGPDGTVQVPLDEDEVAGIAAALSEAGCRSVAVVLLHSYINPDHERRVGALVAAGLDDADISLSVDVLPQPGEYERASTTVMNAYVRPVVRRYLDELSSGLAAMGISRAPSIMQSNGGVMTAASAGSGRAVQTCLSGPAAGLIAARAFAKAAGHANAITVDMGGTSFDVGLVRDGEILSRFDGEIEGLPIRTPMFDIVTLGAGGGSLARIDEGGLLKVGPESAGSTPGPAAYGRGGTQPTVTDANVVLGRLRSGRRLGGSIVIDGAAAADAIATKVGLPTGLDPGAAAAGVLQVVNAAMIRGIRRLTVERGLDPRSFALLAFGGAGPLHAVDLARELGIGTVLIPPAPGLLCALGLLLAPWRLDLASTVIARLSTINDDSLARLTHPLRQHAAHQARADGLAAERLTYAVSADLRYRGQGDQLTIPVDAGSLASAAQAFHREHHRMFGFARTDQPVEITTLRLTAIAPPASDDVPMPPPNTNGDPCLCTARLMIDRATHDVPVLARDRLVPGARFLGPALIEQEDTTVFIGRQPVEVDRYGTLHVRLPP